MSHIAHIEIYYSKLAKRHFFTACSTKTAIGQLPYNTKLSRFHGKLLFCHKTFAVAHDGPKDYACDGDYKA